MTMSPQITVEPLQLPETSSVNFGAQISNVNVENLTGLDKCIKGAPRGSVTSHVNSDFDTIRNALYQHAVVIIKGQTGLSPRAQYELTQRFDPAAGANYGHGKTLDAKRSVLHPDLKTIPRQPQVQVIGNGFIESYEGLENVKLVHPHHRTFHKTRISDEDDLDFTRFYRWHIDAALYGLAPPRVTSLLAVHVPEGRTQTVRYDDGTGDELDVPLGTTAFVSGYTMYERLSSEEQDFVRTSKVEYAPHPYIWMSGARSRSDGLGMASEGKELPESELPPIEQDKVQVLPMCWRNPVTGKLAVQIHPSAVRRIHLKDGSVIDDLAEVRRIVHDIQRPAIAPRFVYPHDWVEGDLVLFNNQGVLHSVVGAFREDEVRLFRQCNIAASEMPLEPEAGEA